MKLSTDRILTTHVGSLPRPAGILPLLQAQSAGTPYNADELIRETRTAVAEVVRRQIEAGLDIVSDGEFGKGSYTHYVRHRLSGIELIPPGDAPRPVASLDDREFPDWAAERNTRSVGSRIMPATCCVGRVSYIDESPLERDLANFSAATAAAQPVEGFVNAASPGVLINFIPNRHYAREDDYLEALAGAMQTEYEAIAKAGFILQIDAPDIAMTRNTRHAGTSDEDFVTIAERNIEALNHATRNIAPEAMRLHLCWGNYAGPHKNDIELRKIMNVVLKSRAQAISFEGANPRHEHEWEDWKEADIPDNKILIPGVIDSACNFVEHPRLIAQRIANYAGIVGRERVIAGADCGFGTFGRSSSVYESVVWAKFHSLAEGAALATKRLWNR
jgi:5-methyltetrahydropteroyltriglutamate--homocysteine methyltransferase